MKAMEDLSHCIHNKLVVLHVLPNFSTLS